jgi:hypothetical protein
LNKSIFFFIIIIQRRQHELELRAMLRDEFLIQLQKFLNQIGLTLRQLEGNNKLNFILFKNKKMNFYLKR